MAEKKLTVYILANDRNGTLYIGATSNLIQRIWQHRNNLVEGFSNKYRTHKLVHFEQHVTMADAILREKEAEEMEPGMEVAIDRKQQSVLAGLVAGNAGQHRSRRHWIPAFAGMTELI